MEMTDISAPSDMVKMATKASAISRAKPSRGFTLVELLIYIVLLSIVSAGIWQSYSLINQSINKTRNLALVNEDLENFNRLISQTASKAQRYSVEGRRDCVSFQTEDINGNPQFINYKIASGTGDLAKNAKLADAWMSTSDSARCTDDVAGDGNWRKITSNGQIDVSAPNRALSLDTDTEISRAAFSALSGASVRSVDFWLKLQPDVETGTIIGWGNPAITGGEFVIDLEDGKIRVRSGASKIISTNKVNNNLWHHVMFSWDGPLLTDGDLFIDGRLDSTASESGNVTVNTAAGRPLFIGGDNNTAPDRLDGIVDEIRLWSATTSLGELYERFDRELEPADEPDLLAYWRFEPDSSQSTYVDKVGSFNLTASDGEFVRPGAPLTLPLFEVAGDGQSAVLKTNFSFVSAEGTTKGAGYAMKQARGTRLNKRVPIVRFAPAGVVAIEDGGETTVAVEVVGDHDQPDIRFEAVFDASISPQYDACNGFTYDANDNPSPCVFDAANNTINIAAACPVPENATLVNCTIDTNSLIGEQGDRFASIRIKDDLTVGETYRTVPGDKLTLQIYETCELSGSAGHTAMLLDVGTMRGEDFINRRSYVTYSWESASAAENVEYIFGTTSSSKDCSGATQDKVKGSPDFGVFTKRKHISPFLFRTTNDNYNFVMGFDKPYVQWGSDTDGWNSCFTSRYQFSTSASDSSEPCSSIGMTEQAMCNAVEDRDSVQVCDSPSNSTKYCYVEFKISNMPTNPSNFVKLDESNEYTLPSSLEGMKGTNRWGGGYTDGFVVNLATDNVSQYGTNTGNPLMQVLSRAGMDFWFLQTKPNDADGGKSLKLTTGETDAVRYRMATARVCS